MTAAKSLYSRKSFIQCCCTKGHRICVIDDPGLWTHLLDGLGKAEEHRKGPSCPHDSSWTCGVSNTLEYSILFRKNQVSPSAFYGSWLNGYDYQINSFQSLLQAIFTGEPEPSFAFVDTEGLDTYAHVIHSSLMVNIMENHCSVGHFGISKILEELDGPKSASTAYYANTSFLHFIPLESLYSMYM